MMGPRIGAAGEAGQAHGGVTASGAALGATIRCLNGGQRITGRGRCEREEAKQGDEGPRMRCLGQGVTGKAEV